MISEKPASLLGHIAAEIRNAHDLDELLQGLLALAEICKAGEGPVDAENELRARGLYMSALPTFGGDAPADTRGVWSWSPSRLLVGDSFSDLEIIDRLPNAAVGWPRH